jgi:hypothetical protein
MGKRVRHAVFSCPWQSGDNTNAAATGRRRRDQTVSSSAFLRAYPAALNGEPVKKTFSDPGFLLPCLPAHRFVRPTFRALRFGTGNGKKALSNGSATMPTLKNLAGNDVAIFLFRFDLRGDGIDFVVNEAIAADRYEDLDEKLKPLAHACGETLLRYKPLSVSTTIMDGNILASGEFEVMLSSGLGKYFPEAEKQALFADAKRIADLLVTVMDRRTQEAKEGKRSNPSRQPAPPDPLQVRQGLSRLGEAKRLQAEARWAAAGKRVRPGLKRLRPEDLPPGVCAVRGYDQRGHCLTFAHDTLGELGKIVLIKIRDGQMLIQAELSREEEVPDSPQAKRKQRLFAQVVAIVKRNFEENFPA